MNIFTIFCYLLLGTRPATKETVVTDTSLEAEIIVIEDEESSDEEDKVEKKLDNSKEFEECLIVNTKAQKAYKDG